MTRSNRRRLTVAAVSTAALAVAGLLSACGAGQIAATANIVAAVPGGSADLRFDQSDPTKGLISVRDATVAPPPSGGRYAAGSSAPLAIRLFNTTPIPVTLTKVTAVIVESNGVTTHDAVAELVSTSAPKPSAAPSSGSASPSGASTTATPSGTTATPSGGGAAPSASAGVKVSPTPSASGSVVPTPTGATQPGQGASGTGGQPPLTIMPSPAPPVILDPSQGGNYYQLVNLPVALTPGETVRLVFTFDWQSNGQKVERELGNSASDDPSANPAPIVAPVAPPGTPGARLTPSE